MTSTATAGVRLLQVEPTTRCNFTCGFCVGRSLDQSDLSLDRYVRALDRFPELERVELHGEGEPTLHPDLAEMARLAHDRGITVSTITNGSLLTRGRAEAILDAGIDALFVSIESADSAAFQEIRGGSLAKVKQGIRTLLEVRAERGLDRPTVGFSVTVLKRTQTALDGIVALYQELGMDGGISLHMLNRMPAYTSAYTTEMQDQTLTRAAQGLTWLRYVRAVRRHGLAGSTLHFSDEIFGSGAAAVSDRPAREYRSCIWLDRGLYLNRHGRTSGCARIKDTSRFGFGGIDEADPAEIVAARDELAGQVRSGLVPKACDGCFVADSIAARMSNLLERSVRAADAGEEPVHAPRGDAIGEVPDDPEAESWVRRACEGAPSRSVREILATIGDRRGLDPDAARVRVLPVLGEMVRRRKLHVAARGGVGG